MILIHLLLSMSLLYAGQSLDFKDIKVLVKNNNKKVKAEGLKTKALQSEDFHFLRSLLPSLQIYDELESQKKGKEFFVKHPELRAQAQFNIFNRGEDYLESKTTKFNVDQQKNSFIVSLKEQTQWAETLYWNLIFYKEMQSLHQQMIKINEKNKSSAKRRIQSGLATDSDRLEFEMTQIELKHHLKEINYKIKTIKQKLSLFIGIEDFSVPNKFIHSHQLEDILEGKTLSSAWTESIKAQSEVYQLQNTISKLYWAPKVNFNIEYEKYNQTIEIPSLNIRDDLQSEWVLSVSLVFDLESVSKTRKLSKSASYKAKALQSEYEYQKSIFENKLQTKFEELKLKHDLVHEVEEEIELAESYYNLTLKEYSRGVKNSPDMLGAANKLYDVKKERLNLIRDYQVAKSEYLALTE